VGYNPPPRNPAVTPDSMLRTLIGPLLLFSSLWTSACSGDASPRAGGPTAGGNEQNPAPATQTQDPAPPPGATLLDTLLAKRTDEPVFLADPEGRTEFPHIEALRGPLAERKIPIDSPTRWHYRTYQYYLNRLIPMVRWRGRIWLVFDHRHEELRKTLDEGFLSKHKVEWQHQFEDATLMLVSNEFEDRGRVVELRPIAGRGSMVTAIEFTKDGSLMLIAGKSGEVRWASRSSKYNGIALRLPTGGGGKAGVFAGGEAGLIGLVLHPSYPKTPKVYLHYNWVHEDGARHAYLSEWRIDASKQPNELTLVDERKLLEVPMVADNHNAGCLRFGPDGFLYVAIGDGEDGKWTIGRSPSNTMRGKILRIDVDKQDEGKAYAVPPDNPFVGNVDFPPETWAWGFRNPWRFSFAPDGRIVCGDIGEDVNEELTFVVRGKHHGWPWFEGAHVRNKLERELDLQPALLPYGRDAGMSVIGGHVYEGNELPDLRGSYVFCDHLSGYIMAIDLPATGDTLAIEDASILARWPLLLTTIEKAPDGELYFGAHTGEVLRLHPASGQAAAAEELTPADPGVARALFAAEFPAAEREAPTAAQIALGKQLFFETAWSADGKRSCATCHDPQRHGQDGRKAPTGATRNTPSVWNTRRQFAQFRDFRAATVEEAAAESLAAHLGNASPEAAVERLRESGAHREAFATAFPGAEPTISVANAGSALGAFLRQLDTKPRWERFLDGDDAALTRDELVGLNSFVSAGCVTCHNYRSLGGGMPQKLGLMKPWTGKDLGRYAIDQTPGQEYFFKVPALFDVAKTAPYYHDGSIATLEEAVRHMAEAQLNRKLSKQQVDAIVTFLGSLTGEPPAILAR
jgi:cytochrome c peroxidase/glucose/arabinose dehydrogenase